MKSLNTYNSNQTINSIVGNYLQQMLYQICVALRTVVLHVIKCNRGHCDWFVPVGQSLFQLVPWEDYNFDSVLQ